MIDGGRKEERKEEKERERERKVSRERGSIDDGGLGGWTARLTDR